MDENFFISYSHEDRDKMEALSKAIKNASKSYNVIVIAKNQSPGKPLSEKVKEGIKGANYLIPIITKHSISNQWVNQEIGYAIALGDKKIFPIVDNSIRNKLKGFIHNQIDLPFIYQSNNSNPRNEGESFRKCYKDLISYIIDHVVESYFCTEISPKEVMQGGEYTTKVKFKGKVRNGFFDNYVKHLDSKWDTWNWDKNTLKNANHTTAGELHGKVYIESEYVWLTTNWPKGKYQVYVQLYDHLIPGIAGRIKLLEQIHNLEII